MTRMSSIKKKGSRKRSASRKRSSKKPQKGQTFAALDRRAERALEEIYKDKLPRFVVRRAFRNGCVISKTKRKGNSYTYSSGFVDKCDGFKGKNVECH